MNILVWDDNSVRCEESAQALAKAGAIVDQSVEVSTWDSAIAPSVSGGISRNQDVVLVHGANADAAVAWMDPKNKAFLLKYGGSPITDGGIPRAVVAETAPLTENEASGIIRAALDGENQQDFEELAKLIWSSIPETLLAWTLMEIYGGDQGAATAMKCDLKEKAESEFRQRSGEASAELKLEKAKELIAEMRVDW